MPYRFTNPFSAAGNWYKGALHAHTKESDGGLTPVEAANHYKTGGFDFLAITDHNKQTVIDSSVFNAKDFLLIPGEEIDVTYNGLYHLVAINAKGVSGFTPDERKGMHPQKVIDRIKTLGGEVILAHPYWSNSSIENTKLCEGLLGVEVYNHGCEVETGNGHSMVHWDDLLRIGKTYFGFAADDAHMYGTFDYRPSDALGGWTMVKAESLTVDAVMQAIRAGNFYASAGPVIKNIAVNGDTIVVETSPVRSICFRTPHWGGWRIERPSGELIERAEFTPKNTVRCLRVECTDNRGRMAWANPMWVL
ncbi:MAG: CehA/McbA family metallohydrolase [Spirochaetes bacterium]|nr:CehA/McbA family metallohydrolase [Spirochaetota bacterium]